MPRSTSIPAHRGPKEISTIIGTLLVPEKAFSAKTRPFCHRGTDKPKHKITLNQLAGLASTAMAATLDAKFRKMMTIPAAENRMEEIQRSDELLENAGFCHEQN